MKTQPHNRLEDRLMSSLKRHWAAVQKKASCISIMWPVGCDASCRHLILCRLNVNLCILWNLFCWWKIKGRSRQLDIWTATFTGKKMIVCQPTNQPIKLLPSLSPPSGVHQVRQVLHVQRGRGGQDAAHHHEGRDGQRPGDHVGHPAGRVPARVGRHR